MFSATSASAFSCAYARVRLRIAVCSSACSFARRVSSDRRLWKSSWSFWRLLPDSFVVDFVVQRDDLLLDVQDLRVALRREFVDLMEVLVRGLDLAVQFADALVDVLPLPREGVRLLLDLPLLLGRVRVLRPQLLQRFLRSLDPVRGSSPFDPEAVQLLLELFRLFPAAVRHLLLELAQPG